MKILRLTEIGKEALGINTGESDRHGGPEHKHWTRRVTDHLRAEGYEVAEEVPVGGGRTVDIIATRGEKQIAFEIETGNSDAEANVKKCLEAGLDDIVVVATTGNIRDKLFRVLSKHSGVKVLAAGDLLKKRRLSADKVCSEEK